MCNKRGRWSITKDSSTVDLGSPAVVAMVQGFSHADDWSDAAGRLACSGAFSWTLILGYIHLTYILNISRAAPTEPDYLMIF